MTRPIQAYFRNEDDALTVKTLLQTYRTEHLEVGGRTDGTLSDGNVVVPLAVGLGNDGSGLGTDTSDTPGQTRGLAPIVALDVMHDNDDVDLDKLTQVLSVHVNEADYDEIVHLIRRNGGYLGKLD